MGRRAEGGDLVGRHGSSLYLEGAPAPEREPGPISGVLGDQIPLCWHMTVDEVGDPFAEEGAEVIGGSPAVDVLPTRCQEVADVVEPPASCSWGSWG